MKNSISEQQLMRLKALVETIAKKQTLAELTYEFTVLSGVCSLRIVLDEKPKTSLGQCP